MPPLSPRELEIANQTADQLRTAEELRRVGHWLLAQADAMDELNEPPITKAGREVIEVRRTRQGSYQLEGVRCGKDRCKCTRGELHGPYWYVYYKVGGKTRARYIGRELHYLTADELS